MGWRALWTVLLGEDPGTDFVSPYSASIAFFVLTALSGIMLRTLNKLFLPKWIQEYVADFISTAEACTYFFENNFVYKYYGSIWLGVAIVLQCYICNRTFEDSLENPTKAFQQFVHGNITLTKVVIKICLQTIAGLASYRFARLIWSLDMIADHHERYYESSCVTDLNVTLLVGFLVEMGASLSDNWLNLQCVAKVSLFDELAKYINAALMIIVGLQTTGMYFNPAMASGHTFGCQGTAAWEHFFVYWVGPFLGCYAAILFDRVLHIDLRCPIENAAKKTQ